MNAPMTAMVQPRAFVPSAYQQKYFDWLCLGKGSAVVVARAGSGKSTTMVRGLPFIDESKFVTMLAFNTVIAQELATKIEALREETGRAFQRVQAKTFHSLGFGAVMKFLGREGPKIITDGGKCRKLCREWLGEVDFERYAEFICKLVGLAKGEGIGALVADTEDRWQELIHHHDLSLDSDYADYPKAIQLARELLQRSNVAAKERRLIDFDDQLYLVILWRLRLWQNDYLIVDEAQDTNPVRRAICKLALRPGGRLIAVGDDKQAIYGFTGASNDALDLIRHQFNATSLPLTVSYRCPKAVVEFAQQIVPDIEYAPGAKEGRVSLAMPRKAALKHLGPHDAILCRNTAPLVSFAYELMAKGVGCKVLGKDIGTGLVSLIKKMKAQGIPALEQKLAEWSTREIAKAQAKGEEGRAEGIADRVECIQVVIDNMAENQRTIPAVIERIETMFSDTNGGVLTLSTCHKAKGKEWNVVAILDPWRMPSKWARQDWQYQQEMNLMYVAYTRAMEHLILMEDDGFAGEYD